MELIERHDLQKIHFLNQMTFKEFKNYCGDSCKNEEERKVRFNILKDFCKTNIKTRGETKRIYSYSLHTPLTTGGRLYCGNSVQGLQKNLRGFLMTHTTDIDMKNCHPVLLRYICKKHNITCPSLEYYINNRDDVLAEFANKDEAKIAFLKAVNDDKRNSKIKSSFFKSFDKEMKDLQTIITSLECYNDIKQSVPSEKKYNWNGSAINRILCMYENQVLQSAVTVLNLKGIEVCALMFDGIMPYGNFYDDNCLLKNITDWVENEFKGMGMEWAYKPHSQTIQMPDDFVVPADIPKKEVNIERSFEHIVKEFEKTHCKIINKAMFVKRTDNKSLLLTLKQLEVAYAHMSYEAPVVDKEGKITDYTDSPFIQKWTGYSHNILRYDDMEIYPNPTLCPSNLYNLWTPFSCEKYYTPYEKNEEALKVILDHIKILCDNDPIVYDYFVKWIAQMIQFPEVKSVCITLISDEGSGKGTLMKLIQKMLGDDKYFETTTPSRDVWGNFNAIMKDAFFVNLNELSKKETMEAEGVIKGLITDEALTINQKGISQFKIKSYHRFLITTNKEDPIKTTKGDRRKVIIRSSDEKKGDVEYFNNLYKLLDDIDVIRTCYDYFKSIEGMDKFGDIERPVTEYQNNMKELSRSPIELWLEHFTRENFNKEEVELLGKDTYDLFKTWCTENDVTYDANPTKIGVQLSNMKINGIDKGRKTKKGDTKIFNIDKLKKHFNIGCLIDFAGKNNGDVEECDYL